MNVENYAPSVRTRLLAGAAVGYVVLRVVIAWVRKVHVHADTGSYDFGISFTGSTPRPWVMPLVYQAGWEKFVLIQAAISGVAFCVLALALASTMRDRRVQYGIAAVVLLIGVAPRLLLWDNLLLSESLALSMTALLIACLARLDRVPWWATTIVFVLWVFVRDGHLYMGALLLAFLAIRGSRTREWMLPAAITVVMLWAVVAYQNDRYVEALNVTANIAYQVEEDPSSAAWFYEQGMPTAPSFTDQEFYVWASTDGPGVYVKFLATHPGYTLNGLTHLWRDGHGGVDTILDNPTHFGKVVPPGFGAVWPKDGRWTLALAAVAVAGSVLVAARRRRDGRWTLPTLLALSTIPHALLVSHASPWELGRHGVGLSFVLVVSCWWMIALTADALLSDVDDGEAVGVDGGDIDEVVEESVAGGPVEVGAVGQ